MRQFPLHDPRDEHDSCGVGMVADLQGRRSHKLLQRALIGAENLAHRGAVSADGKSGDGAGILTQLPHRLFPGALAQLNRAEDLGVGMLFLPVEARAKRAAQKEIDQLLESAQLGHLGWREVPVDPSALGALAERTRPSIMQVLVQRPRGLSEDQFESLLYIVRRRIERELEQKVSVCSFSHRTLVYKGLLLSTRLAQFYVDLQSPSFETAVAVFHQRYSTNTAPAWASAQPFRALAHNGEINTIFGNAERFCDQAIYLDKGVLQRLSPKLQLEQLLPLIDQRSSDSAQLDAAIELLLRTKTSLPKALSMALPPRVSSPRAEHFAPMMPPWDGPAAVCATDGLFAVAALDRNGLRPLCMEITASDFLVVGSEAGLVPLDGETIIRRDRLCAGGRVAVDLSKGTFWEAEDHGEEQPYAQWLRRYRPPSSQATRPGTPLDHAELTRRQAVFGYHQELLLRVLEPMALRGETPLGSMGDDTPLAALSSVPLGLYRFFKQRFAQVTNPPIDPIRERSSMSLRALLGPRGSIFDPGSAESAQMLELSSPIIDSETLTWLQNKAQADHGARFSTCTLNARFQAAGEPGELLRALDTLTQEALEAVERGARLLILSDRHCDQNYAPIPMLLATATIHRRLIEAKKRPLVSIICDSGEALEDHQFACLLGYGASAVHPYLAWMSVQELAARKQADPALLQANYRRSAEAGLLKILSKMGVSAVESYIGAQLFEALGLDASLVDRFFTGTRNRLSGVGLQEITEDVLQLHASAYEVAPALKSHGVYRFKRGGETHAFNPSVFRALHRAVRERDQEAYAQFSSAAAERPPSAVRDLLEFRASAAALPLEEIESAADIASRFLTGAMSFGALSSEAHEAIAVGMNQLGGRSNSGEGGEALVRLRPYDRDRPDRSVAPWKPKQGDHPTSAIKQVASGRFGVHAAYLMSAQEIEIKMAQGAKPGEGGQIPGHKVTASIAEVRAATPGLPLISPPPHHDIYSIEDLSQLIYDLKRLHPRAKVGVKLASTVGIGTIAAGVAKALADFVHIAGHSGGTGASPLSSLRHAGLPWELGLAEAHQVLVKNGLRSQVSLRVDGGLQTGRDVAVAAALGADEFGFGTSALVAIGCVMARQCHLDRCPVGIATQRETLRKKFPGRPEHLISYLLFVAEEIRHLLAQLGLRSMGELRGRADLLQTSHKGFALQALITAAPSVEPPRHSRAERVEVAPLDALVLASVEAQLGTDKPISKRFSIYNADRSVGAQLAGEITSRGLKLPEDALSIHFKGTAGQSFGAFTVRGMNLHLRGVAQDYVGKSMSGGRITIAAPDGPKGQVILGNTVLYGATGGELYAAGRAGERLCVRNSGARCVVEGCSDHGCEYMTGGQVLILGPIGRNFGAGMTGGEAFVLAEEDPSHALHSDQLVCEALDDPESSKMLRAWVETHVAHTNSARGERLLQSWSEQRFFKIKPPIAQASTQSTKRTKTSQARAS